MPTPEEKLAKRFWSFVNQQPDGCWLWSGCKNQNGYGYFSIRRKNQRAHRVAYAIAIGPIPEDLCVLHSCDVPACVNPAHLFIGTHAENYADMIRKGRRARVRGEQIGSAKLTRDDVLAIREAKGTRTEIAQRFGITNAHVKHIRERKIWAWL